MVYRILDVPRVICVFQTLSADHFSFGVCRLFIILHFLPLNIRLHVTILTQTITLQDLAISTSRRLYIYFLFKPPEILILSHSRAGSCLFTRAASDD